MGTLKHTHTHKHNFKLAGMLSQSKIHVYQPDSYFILYKFGGICVEGDILPIVPDVVHNWSTCNRYVSLSPEVKIIFTMHGHLSTQKKNWLVKQSVIMFVQTLYMSLHTHMELY